eukprot:scaffold8753_cov106-Skeletonema_menzelii.AAC.1
MWCGLISDSPFARSICRDRPCSSPWKARASWGKEDGTCKIDAGMKRWRVALVGDANNEG